MATNLQSASRAALNKNPSAFGAGAAVADLLSAQNLEKAGAGLRSANTIPELEKAIADGEKALGIQSKVQTAVDVADVAGNLSALGSGLQGDLPTVGNVVAQGAVQAIPFGGLASAVLPDRIDPIAKGANLLSRTVDKVPGVSTVNRGIEALESGIRKVPGAVTTGKALSVAGGMTDTILGGMWEAVKSPFSSTARESEYADRVAALKDYLRPLILNNQLTEDHQLGEIGYLRGLPEHGDMPSFQAASTFHDYKGMTVGDLRQTPEGKEALNDLSQVISGSRDVARIEAGENALMQDIMSTDPYTGEAPMHNIKSYDDYSNLNIGTAYTDEHGTWDAMTGEPVDPLNPIIKSTPIRKTQAGGPGPSRFFAPSQPAPKVETGPRRTFGSTSYDRRNFYGLTGGTRR